jgi:1-acyl-sn-glycerol-3-phosphate acyltransferase
MRKYGRLIPLLFFPLFFSYVFVVFPNMLLRKLLPLSYRYRSLRAVVKLIYKGLRIQRLVENESFAHQSKDQFIVCNHHSFIDPFLIIDLFPHPIRFLAKKETRTLPIFGDATASIDAMFIKRESVKSQVLLLRQMKVELEKRTTNWLVFPEGTRNREFYSQPLLPFKPGAFKQAMEAKVNILPMVTYGFQRILDKSIHWKKYPVQIAFLDPITPEMYEGLSTREVADLVRERMQAKSDKLFLEDQRLQRTIRKSS